LHPLYPDESTIKIYVFRPQQLNLGVEPYEILFIGLVTAALTYRSFYAYTA
jgi:hypothetical protein